MYKSAFFVLISVRVLRGRALILIQVTCRVQRSLTRRHLLHEAERQHDTPAEVKAISPSMPATGSRYFFSQLGPWHGAPVLCARTWKAYSIHIPEPFLLLHSCSCICFMKLQCNTGAIFLNWQHYPSAFIQEPSAFSTVWGNSLIFQTTARAQNAQYL